MPLRETLAERQQRLGRGNAFGPLRLLLAGGIVAFHAVTLTQGHADQIPPLLLAMARLILPAFFSISGFLVTASLARAGSVREYLLLRMMRLMPGLSVVVALTALVLGPVASRLPLGDYLSDPLLPRYFLNVWGVAEFRLPGLFEANPRAGIVNGSLWTIPLEMTCYVALALMLPLLRGRLRQLGVTAGTLVLLLPWWDLPGQELFAAFAMGVLVQTFSPWLPYHPVLGIALSAAALWLAWAFPHLALAGVPLAYAVIWIGLWRGPAWRSDYSYGLYLAAYPVQQWLLAVVPGHGWMANLTFGGGLALGCAMALWYGIEKPVLSRKHEWIVRLIGRHAHLHAR